MPVLVEPPVEVVWAEEAGPMSWVEDVGWEPGPLEEPRDEVAYWLAEWEASLAEPADAEPSPGRLADWAVPGVPRFGESEPAVLPHPSAEVAAYAAAVSGLMSVDLGRVAPDQALADLAELLRVDELLRPVRLERLTDAHVRRLARLQDEVSLQTWARKRFDDVPRDDISTAKELAPYVWLRNRLADKAVTVEAARLVGRALKKLRRHVDRDNGLIDGQPSADVIEAVVGNVLPLVAQARTGLRDGEALLEALQTTLHGIVDSPDTELGKLERAFTLMAEHIPLRHLKGALDQQLDAILPGELEDDADRARQRRSVRLDPTTRSLQVRPDDELYELAHTVLAAEVARDPENPADTEAKRELREQGDVEAEGDVRFPRTREQRLHDGLKRVFQNYLAAGLAGSHDKAPVAVTVTLPLEKLEKSIGALPAVGGSGRRLPASLVGRWWCDASVTGLVMSAGWIPLGATHTMRTLTGLERKASRVQHGQACDGLRCCTPHDPLTTLVPHHVYSYAKFGRTSMAETVWLCPRLHDAIHRGKTVQLRDGRWLNADGWTTAPLTVDY